MLQLMMISITKNATLNIDVPGNVPPIRANKAQMRQLVMNLVTNASDALRIREELFPSGWSMSIHGRNPFPKACGEFLAETSSG